MMAQALGMTPEQLTAFIGQQYQDVATGLQQLPSIVAQFRTVVAVLAAEHTRFERADAIPTSNLPATTIPWGLLIAGVVLVGIGLVMTIRPARPWAGAGLVVGALMIVVPLAMSLPGKASAADTMNAHLKPVYTAEMLTGAKGALATVGAMGQQMQGEMLPGLAQQLGMDEAQLQAFLGQNLPAVAAGTQAMPTAMPMFENLVTTFDAHLADWNTLKPVAFVPIVWTMIAGGVVALLAGAWALVPSRKHEIEEVEQVQLKAA
jgi:hypothetical protein